MRRALFYDSETTYYPATRLYLAGGHDFSFDPPGPDSPGDWELMIIAYPMDTAWSDDRQSILHRPGDPGTPVDANRVGEFATREQYRFRVLRREPFAA